MDVESIDDLRHCESCNWRQSHRCTFSHVAHCANAMQVLEDLPLGRTLGSLGGPRVRGWLPLAGIVMKRENRTRSRETTRDPGLNEVDRLQLLPAVVAMDLWEERGSRKEEDEKTQALLRVV